MIQLDVLFKKIQKDDKKEVLMFHVQSDELPSAQELLAMPGSITLITVEGSNAGEVGAEFVSIQRDDKKTVLKFNIKRDAGNQIDKLYPLAGNHVSIKLQPSQMSIDEFYEERQGIEYTVNGDSTVEVNKDQMNIEEVEPEAKIQRVK
jgi:hypothetical protein